MNKRLQRRKFIGRVIIFFIVIFILCLLALGFYSFMNYKTGASTSNGVFNPSLDITTDFSENDMKLGMVGKAEESINRPLFMKNREPFIPPSKAVSEEELPEDIADIAEPIPLVERLASIVITDTVKMIFLETSEGMTKLEQGMSYNGWTLDEVNSDSAKLSNGDATETLELRTFAVAAPTETLILGENE